MAAIDRELLCVYVERIVIRVAPTFPLPHRDQGFPISNKHILKRLSHSIHLTYGGKGLPDAVIARNN